MALSLTPPLIKNNINPGEIWRSAIKVINNNPEPINIYLSTLDFKSGKDNGTVEFIQNSANLNEDAKQYSLSQWIVIEPGPVAIPAFGSIEVPFIIDVPETAGPGGHYAAILAGTKPPAGKIGGTNIKISSLLASLILLNVNGDVKEAGQIREFSTDKKVFYDPKVNFTVRFENLGNVHIQPQGEIKVYNFFNQEKKLLTLNHNSEFGNVLPGEIRQWQFSYEGGRSLLDMGRYRAELVLNYGDTAKQTVDQKIFFWIIYPKPLAIALSIIIGLILIIIFIIRRYIKKSIMRTQAQYGIVGSFEKKNKPEQAPATADNAKEKVSNSNTSKNALNLKTGPSGQTPTHGAKHGWGFFKKLMLIVFVLVVLILAAIIYLNYRESSHPQAENNQKTIENPSVSPPDNSTDKKENSVGMGSSSPEKNSPLPLPEENKATNTSATTSENEILPGTADKKSESDQNKENLVIRVLNGSGRPGVANDAAALLEDHAYPIAATANADSFNYFNTVIKYKKGLSQAVGQISGLFSEVPDVQEVTDQAADIIIIVGKNYK